MQKVMRKFLRVVADYDPDYYDMYADPNEAIFAQLYVRRIAQHAALAGILPPASVLEAGCQAGRLVVPFAKQGFQVTGIDTSGFALRRARKHVQAAGVDARFVQGNLVDVLRAHPDWQYEIVVCAEVLYLSPDYRTMLQRLAAAVRPGGLLCVSHRPKLYYALEALRHRDLDTAQRVLTSHEGQFDGPFHEKGYYNWQTEEELRGLYASLGLRQVKVYPIDQSAWLAQVTPSQLTTAEQDQWLQLELGLSSEAATCARYTLVIATRPCEGEQ